MGPLVSLLNPAAFLEPIGPPKSIGPGIIVPPAPSLGGPGCGAHKSYGCRGQSKLYDAIQSQCSGARQTRIR